MEDCEPVDINETTGYLTDNTNGEFTETKVADKAYDYDGLWLFWWDLENKVDIGGGGTIAYIMANYGMDVVDSGVAVLNMHAPYEVSSKSDIYQAVKGYKAFLKWRCEDEKRG